MFGLNLRSRRARIEFNQVLFFRFQLAKVMVMTVDWECAAGYRRPVDWGAAAASRLSVGFWLRMSIGAALH